MKPQKNRILVVENEGLVAMDITECLQSAGYDVVATANCAADALKYVDTKHPDLILMDIMLDGVMDGIEVAGIIRLRTSLPVIFITAFTTRDLLDRAKLTQPFCYLTKPFEDRELLANIEIALYRHEQEKLFLKNCDWFTNSLSDLDDALILVDRYNNVVFMNSKACELTGWSNEAISLPLNRILHIYYPAKTSTNPVVNEILTDSLIVDVLSEGKTIIFENNTCLVQRDGRKTLVAGSITPISRDEDLMLGAVLVFEGIDQEKTAKEIRKNPESIVKVTTDGIIDLFARGAERIFGFHASEVVGKNIEMLLPKPFQSGVRKDGSFFPIHLAINKMRVGERSLFISLLFNLVLQNMNQQRRMETSHDN